MCVCGRWKESSVTVSVVVGTVVPSSLVTMPPRAGNDKNRHDFETRESFPHLHLSALVPSNPFRGVSQTCPTVFRRGQRFVVLPLLPRGGSCGGVWCENVLSRKSAPMWWTRAVPSCRHPCIRPISARVGTGAYCCLCI